ncbi:MAG TPA: TatD family hydrolase [Spirochaetota bacterium]|nr:TatD family hydrolase [Spirochaetota bacterium]HRX46897.1 TatD family hydrolase [Spirochaetota bacterium]
MIIDFHTHIFPDKVIEHREHFLTDASFALLYSSEKSRMTGYRELLEYIDENSLYGAAAMSFPWGDADLCRMHNDYMSEAALSGAGKIFPFGMVPSSDTGSVRKTAGEIKASGLYGIGELAFYDKGMDENACRFLREVFEAAIDLSLPVCIHLNEPVGHAYPGKYDPSLGSIYRIISEYRECRVVLSHWGGGMLFYELMPEVKEALRNVWYDTAATPYLYSSSIYKASAGIIPAEKILFGTDFPLLGVKRYIDDIRKNIESGDIYKKIMGQNALSLLKPDEGNILMPDD